MVVLCLLPAPASAATLTFTITASEPVTVAGTPRVAIDVGGVTRYATFSGNGSTPSTSLPFSYAVQAGDFDANGIDVSPQLDLNGGTLTDRAGNAPAVLTFTKPNTSALKVQTYTASFTDTSNLAAVSFTIAKAPIGASFSYTIGSSGGSSTVTGSGTIGSSSHTVSGIDVTNLPGGTLTLSVTVSNASGTGSARTASVTPSYTGILDSLPTSAAAYSVRRLRAAYTGPLLRVRRTTDSVQQNVGFTMGGSLDMAALTTFCGSASCFVSTWYDQSTDGWNALEGNPAAQPRIVNAGSAELLNSRPGVRFTGAVRLTATGFPSNANEFTVSIAAKEVNRKNNDAWVLDGSANRVLSHMPYGDGVLYFDVNGGASPNRLQGVYPIATGTPAILNFRNSASTATRSLYLNGGLFLSGTGFAAPASQLLVGTNYDGIFSEFILFTSSISDTSRQALERSQGSYFGVSVP